MSRSGAAAQTIEAVGDSQDSENDLTPVTYYALETQKQFQANQVELRGKPYEFAFTPIRLVPSAWAEALQYGPLSQEQALSPSIADINRVFDPAVGRSGPGYALLDGPTAYMQDRIELKGVTAEMYRWWFTWFPLEKQRFMIWFP